MSGERTTEPPSVTGDDRVSLRNFLVMAAYQVVMRTGWIFKTESIVMPAVLDHLGGSGLHRGFLPLLNRLGHSVPPLWMAPRVRGVARKKWLLTCTTLLLSVLFIVIASLFPVQVVGVGAKRVLFLVLYGIFFATLGINQLTFHTLQGKLIRVNRRGRLMLVSNVAGAVLAITCVWLLMPRWLNETTIRIDLLFGFAGLCFGGCAMISLALVEFPDDFGPGRLTLRHRLWTLQLPLRRDRNFRRLAFVSVMFGCSFVLFPHYQALGQRHMSLGLVDLTTWVIVQNAGTACFSLLCGPLADLRGNRLVLRILMLGLCLAPLAALGLSYLGESGGDYYPLVFVLVGLTPVGIRTLNNYTLEIADRRDQPTYLGTLGLCLALPNLLSPLMGWVLDKTSYEVVFLLVCGLLCVGWLATFRLSEPRHHAAPRGIDSYAAPDS